MPYRKESSEALIAMMIESAQSEVIVGEYEYALKYAAASIAMAPALMSARVKLIEIAISLLSSSRLKIPLITEACASKLIAKLASNVDRLSEHHQTEQLAGYFINAAERKALVDLSRDWTAEDRRHDELHRCAEDIMMKAAQLIAVGSGAWKTSPLRSVGRAERFGYSQLALAAGFVGFIIAVTFAAYVSAYIGGQNERRHVLARAGQILNPPPNKPGKMGLGVQQRLIIPDADLDTVLSSLGEKIRDDSRVIADLERAVAREIEGASSLRRRVLLAAQAAADVGRYDEAVRLQETYLSWVEETETKWRGGTGKATAEALGLVAWYCLFARDFPKALALSERAHAVSPDLLWVETNRAHALMFLQRKDEARSLYVLHKGERVPTHGNALWEQTIVDDFSAFRKVDLTDAMMAEITEAITSPIRKP